MNSDRLIAAWESKGGKYRVELYRDAWGYRYKANGAGGNLGALANDAAALAAIEQWLPDFQADANKTPMRRVSTGPALVEPESTK